MAAKIQKSQVDTIETAKIGTGLEDLAETKASAARPHSRGQAKTSVYVLGLPAIAVIMDPAGKGGIAFPFGVCLMDVFIGWYFSTIMIGTDGEACDCQHRSEEQLAGGKL
ncbi:hypothetical protein IW262DRAFT_318396 [Armillaria fumosa]|nr:hypothetical protein IW262DRAFT_318396 [Armillaria fumosa]